MALQKGVYACNTEVNLQSRSIHLKINLISKPHSHSQNKLQNTIFSIFRIQKETFKWTEMFVVVGIQFICDHAHFPFYSTALLNSKVLI